MFDAKKTEFKMEKLLYMALIVLSSTVSARAECEQGECEAAPIRTRRRAPPVVEQSCSDGAMTPSQAQNILNNSRFESDRFDHYNMKNKSDFRKAASDLIPAVCKNISIGGPSVSVFSNRLNTWLNIKRIGCGADTGNLSDVPCQGCNQIGKFKVMKDDKNNTEWNCTHNSNDSSICDGACLGSIRMAEDLMSNYSTKCSSHVLDVQMFNPNTNKEVHFNSTHPVMSVQIQFDKGEKQYNNTNFRCALWKEEFKLWDTSLCTLEIVPKQQENDPEVANCKCTRFGPVCIVNADAFDHIPNGQGQGQGQDSGKGEGQGNGQQPQPTTTPSGTTSSNQGIETNSSSQSQTTTSSQSETTASSQSGTSSSSQSGTSSSSQSNGDSGTTAASLTTTSSNDGSNGSPNEGKLYLTVTYPGDCNSIINTEIEQEIISKTKEKIKLQLSVKDAQIDAKLKCGSIIVEITISQLNSSTLDEKTQQFTFMLQNNHFVFILADGSKYVAINAGIGLSSGNLTLVQIPTPTASPTTRERFVLKFDYRPIIFTVAFVILAVVLCVCISCIVHSYWLRKEKFTEYNSMTAKEYEMKQQLKKDKERMKEVEEVPMTALGTSSKISPTNFDMSNETMPKINERSFTNYDWAHTSFLPTAVTTGLQPGAGNQNEPKLMLDESDSSDSDEGEENEGFEGDETPSVSRAVSHLSLAKDKTLAESSDSMSNVAPPLYETIEDVNNEHIYDNIKDCKI